MLKIYNSLTRKEEEFKPLKEGHVSMYVCGSTVYNDMHIGNTRPVVFFDVVARFFRFSGYDVKFVSNFTDIDDKIIKKALQENKSEKEVADHYIKSILATYRMLNCLPHFKNPQVTKSIPDIIAYIAELVEKGAAYVIDNDVYFDITKDPTYGILSGQEISGMIMGARVDENNKKRHPGDFNLWKKTEVGMRWPSPWGEGRPGWHTECVAMIESVFKNKIDIHGGGSELKFPHHENEIAQAAAAKGHHLATYWMHNGRVDMNGVKMSKSLGNVVMANDLLHEIGYGAYRLLLLEAPYKQPLNYRHDAALDAKTEYDKIYKSKLALARLLQINFDYNDINDYQKGINNLFAKEIKDEFISAMEDDFNTANAITTLIKTVKAINTTVRKKDIDYAAAVDLLTLINQEMYVLGIDQDVMLLEADDIKLVRSWQNARKEKRFLDADRLRDEINAKGIVLS